MVKIELADLIEIVIGNMAEFSASGHMAREGASFYETPYDLVAMYDTVAVDYIIYQQEGFIHYLSGKFINKNQGFIDRTQNNLEYFVWGEVLGIPYNKLENNQILLENSDKLLMELGAVKNV